jgi:hypothetical protein
MLEENEDILSAPLDGFDDVSIEAEAEPEDVSENELEEIEEVFDASQSSKRAKRSINYTEIEDICLVKAWEGVTQCGCQQ